MYLFVNKTKNDKKAKGIKKNVINREIDHSNYLDCIQNNSIMRHKMKSIRSEYHQISINFLYLVMMTKGIFLTMVLLVSLMEIVKSNKKLINN